MRPEVAGCNFELSIALTGGWSRWPPEVPFNLIISVTTNKSICGTCFLIFLLCCKSLDSPGCIIQMQKSLCAQFAALCSEVVGSLSCFRCVDHKGGTVPGKWVLLVMRPYSCLFKVQNTPVLLVRDTSVCLRVVLKLWFCHSLVTWKSCCCRMLFIPIGLCFVPEFSFVERNDAVFPLWSECYKERATVLQP